MQNMTRMQPLETRGSDANSPSFVLHIGRHKTGTTALQAFLAQNEELLAKKFGILYPLTGRDRRKHYHHPVFDNVINRNKRMDPKLVPAILEEAAAKNTRTILLSSEMLGRSGLTDEQLEQIRDAFAAHAIKIIMYFRRQDSYLQSAYANRIKKGLLAAPATIHDIDVNLDYMAFAKRYANIFGHDDIIIRSYDDAVRSSIFGDFLRTLGVEDDSEFRQPPGVVNQRLPWRYLELLRVANRSGWQRKIVVHNRSQKLARWFYNRFPDFMDSPKPLDEAECRSLLAQFEENNAEVERLFMNRKRLFSEVLPGRMSGQK